MSALSYKGLSTRIEFDAEDEIFVCRIAGINDVVGFHADTAQGLKAAFHDDLDACGQAEKESERAYSGKLMERVKPELHHRLALASELSGKSINQLGEDAIAAFVGRGTASPV